MPNLAALAPLAGADNAAINPSGVGAALPFAPDEIAAPADYDPFGKSRGRALPSGAEMAAAAIGEPCDPDGFVIPARWRANSQKWNALALVVRKKWSEAWLEARAMEIAKEAAKKQNANRTPATRFTTDYAVAWGRKQGWKLIDRETYDFKNKRHHDLMLGLDCLFDDGKDGMVGVQGAGRSEKTPHYQRFLDRGGVALAQRRGIRVVYVEFERGNNTPVLLEWWA